MGETHNPEGGCTCGRVRYQLLMKPLFVHCCHCRWCQRETGSAFVVNALIEADQVKILQGSPETVDTPTLSGRGQKIVRCAVCKVAVWSHYAAAGEAIRFVRVGTLDKPSMFPPDIHIFTMSKQPWVLLQEGTAVAEKYYRMSQHWPSASLDRYKKATGR